MISDKEILYSVLSRYIDNACAGNPGLMVLSGPIKNWVFKYIDPYIDFFFEEDNLNSNMAASFVEDELSDRIKKFKNIYDKEKEKVYEESK